ncbi:unnamed protein product [Urochloa humidicola]
MTRTQKDLPGEVTHPSHPAHKLELVDTAGAPFKCDGCKEPGDGPRYTCGCGGGSFDLHPSCALAEDTVAPPLFGGATFEFLPEPPAPSGGRICDACGDDVRGFVYHCSGRGLDLHQPCAALRASVTHGGHAFELQNKAGGRCIICRQNGRRRNFWAYRSRYDGRSVYLHVACMKEMARRRWEDQAYSSRLGGGCIVQASVPMVEGLLQSMPRNAQGRSGFDRFVKMLGTVVSVIIAVIFGNPFAMIAAVVGPTGFLRD